MLDTYIKIFTDQKNLVSLIQYKKISLNVRLLQNVHTFFVLCINQRISMKLYYKHTNFKNTVCTVFRLSFLLSNAESSKVIYFFK